MSQGQPFAFAITMDALQLQLNFAVCAIPEASDLNLSKRACCRYIGANLSSVASKLCAATVVILQPLLSCGIEVSVL